MVSISGTVILDRSIYDSTNAFVFFYNIFSKPIKFYFFHHVASRLFPIQFEDYSTYPHKVFLFYNPFQIQLRSLLVLVELVVI